MINMLFDGVQVGFEEAIGPGGVEIKILVVTDPQSGISAKVPLMPEAQRAIAAHLDGRPPIQVVGTMPTDLKQQ